MKKKFKIVILSIVSIFISLFGFIAILAYYEYYGQYSTILNVDGTIKLDAFDVLYPELRELDSYGRTPDNPYVIDNATRLRNLIKLNNSGKLLKSKRKDNVDKYYFNLQFDAQEIPQILNLISEGEFSTIGNNEFPFVDELSGIVYGYEYTNGYIAYYSGCLPIYTKKDNAIYINGVISNIDATQSPYSSWTETDEYILSTYQYDSSITQVDGITYDDSSTPTFININDTTIIHQVIANETIAVADNQIDIGFISNIGDNGYAHDIILYNETLVAKEENLFATWLSSLTELFSDHKRVKTDLYEERHIGLFAGHISENGNAKNISVSGESNINIDTERVNYYSNFTTVGYIDDNALIGGRLFSEIALDSMNDGEIAGCLFADVIYNKAIDESLSGSTDSDGATHYTLTEVGAESPWPGTDGTEFKYGSFTFLLSASTDTVSSIWANSSELYMLNQQGYKINGSALYCTDEYRYQADNGINQGGASVKEATYSGVTKLENTGNVIDKGKYAIVAHIDDKYYALKIYATEDASGNITYYFDTSDKINITQFINGHADTNPLYQSALWEVLTPSATPTFLNSRFTDEYFDGDTSSQFLNATNNLAVANATQFSINLSENTFYFDNAGTRYYLNFDESENSFYFSDSASTSIELFNITDGYTLTGVTSANNITNLGSYIIVARDTVNDTYKLLGVNYNSSEGIVLQEFDDDLDYTDISGFDNSGFTSPVVMSATEYKDYANYIWRISKNGNNISIVDRISNSLYLSSNGTLMLSNQTSTWTYSQGTGYSCRLNMGNNYLSFNGNITDGNTRFTSTTTNPGYILYLFEITPQDETPPYITYDGAKYLDATASTIETGDYSIIATNEYGEEYAIGINGSSVSLTNRYAVATSYNSMYDYYQRTGSGTAIDPYVYEYEEDLEDYTFITITSQSELNAAIATYGTIYEDVMVPIGTYTYEEALVIPSSNIYWNNNGTYRQVNSNTNLTVNRQYYLKTGSNYNPLFIIDGNTTYYTNTNGTVATRYRIGNTYYTRSADLEQQFRVSTIYDEYSNYYFKTFDCNNAVTYYIDYVYSNNPNPTYYEWTAVDSVDSTATTTSSPLFKNVNSASYYYNGTSVSTTGFPVYYDAINQQLFYMNNDTVYYIYLSNSNTLSTSTTLPTTTNVRLYKIDTIYSYDNMTRITYDNYTTGFKSNYIMISTLDLTNTSNAAYLVGIDNFNSVKNLQPADGSTYITGNVRNYTQTVEAGYHSMQNNYRISGNSLITTEDISNYVWMYSGDNYNNQYFNIYNYGWHNSGNSGCQTNHLYLAANKAAGGGRQLVLNYSNTPIYYQNTTSGTNYNLITNNNITGFGFDTSDYLYIRGNSTSYYLGTSNSTSTMALSSSRSSVTNIYYYYFSSITTISTLTLISSNGDMLEEGIHYAIAAESNGNYYSMTYDSDNPTNGIFGTDMTSQINLIKSVGTYTSTTTIPSNCDWIQVSNNYELRFKHYNSSDSDYYNYLDQASTNGISTKSYSTSYAEARKYYYDIVNKLLSYSYIDTIYYVTYNASTNKFESTTDKDDASQIYIIRYTPSYQVNCVDSIDTNINSGEYVIAGHSAEGYKSFGIEDSVFVKDFDITNYLTSNLTEEQYNAIQGYIWKQNNSSSYTGSQSELSLLFSNLVTGSGFAAYQNQYIGVYFGGYSDVSTWKASVNSSGLWRFLFGETISNTTPYYMDYVASSSVSNLKVVDTYKAINAYISSQTSISSSSDAAKQIAIYNVNDLENAVTSISGGNNYIVLVKNGTYWYLLYLNNNSLAYVQIGKNLNDLEIKLLSAASDYNYIITSATGPSDSTLTFGCYLYFVNNNSNYYLATSGNNLVVTTQQQTSVNDQTMHWDYSYNSIYPNKSYLYVVSKATVNNNLGVSGSKVTTTGTATYVYTVNYTNSQYSLGSIATSIASGSRYAIVIFDSGNYYIVSRESENSTNITYKSYGSGLPTTLSEYEVFSGASVTNGRSFTQVVNNETYYLIVNTDTTLTLSTNVGNCYFTYNNPSLDNSAIFSASQSGEYEMYLFRITKKDSLDNTTDVTVTLSSASQIAASLSVVKSDDYIIVANVGDKYYALSVTGYDDLVALDITETMTDALAGGNIRLYTASIFEQLGTEYSMIFNSEAFNGSFYYLLDGTYETTGSSNKPVITPISLYNSTETYYTVNATVYAEALNNTTILEHDYYYYVSGCYIKALTYDEHLVYFTLECVQFDGTDFDENKTYYQMESGYVEAYEYKNYVKYYIRNGNSYDLVNISEFATGVTYYINLGTDAFVAYNSKRTEGNNISDSYKWTIIPYSDTGQTGYVIGYYDDAQDNTRYIYYDSTNREFKLTTTISQAYASGALVQAYRLGNEITQSDAYKTFNIYLEDDNVTIISFPLNEVTSPNDITLYSQNESEVEKENGTTMSVIPGEYLFAYKDGDYYYALTLDSNNDLSY